MKTESLTSGLVRLRNELQPSYRDNVSTLLFDYDFFTRAETFIKKEREKAKQKCIDVASVPEDKTGVLLETPTMTFELAISKPGTQFDLDKFIDAICKFYPDVMRHKLRELSTEAVVETKGRRTYSVKQKETG